MTTVPALVIALGAAACLADCGSGPASSPTGSPSAAASSPTAAATPTPTPSPAQVITGSPTPPPATPTPAPPVSSSGAAGQSMTITPGTIARGGTVRITGYAPQCTGVTLISKAFPGPQEFAGINAVSATSTPDGHFSATVTIPASTPPGAYSVTARACGGNLGLDLTLTVT